MNRKIYFEDHGQDFLWWEIDSEGIVVDAGPFQSSIWTGCIVEIKPEIKSGDRVVFITKNDQVLQLNYPVSKIV